MTKRPRPCRDRAAALFAVIVAGGALSAERAEAEDPAVLIDHRVQSVFELVPPNNAELAIPLTRRALARRSLLEDGGSAVAPVAEARPAPSDPPPLPAAPPMPPAKPAAPAPEVAEAASAFDEAEEGSAEDDPDALTRLPKPRPKEESAGAPSVAEPAQALELIAKAAPPAPPKPPGPRKAEPVSAPAAQAAPPVRSELALVATTPDTRRPIPPPDPGVTAALAPAPTGPEAPVPPAAPPATLAARQDCVPVSKVHDKDGDFGRNAEALEQGGFCITVEKFKERRRPWTVQTVESGRPGPLWAVMHDDEDVAFDTAVHGLKEFGGVLVTLDTGGKRNQDGIDPNRNFSDEKISCAKLGEAVAPRFTAAFAKRIDPSQPIIALHNNINGRTPTTGIGHVSMTTVPKAMRVARSDDPDGPLASERALILLAALEPVSTEVENRMDALSSMGINVVLERVKEGRGDCSLSNYAVLSGHKDYFNVTVNFNEAAKQRRIVDAILSSAPAVATAE